MTKTSEPRTRRRHGRAIGRTARTGSVAAPRKECRPARRQAAAAARAARSKRVILVPVDLSELSARALDYALTLARRLGASVTLLHVVSGTYGEGFVDSAERLKLRARAIEDARLRLNLLAASRAHHRVPMECVVRHGEVKYEIFRFAEMNSAHLIVLARRSRALLSRWVFGSVTSSVVDVAPCAVVILPKRPAALRAIR